MQRTIVFHIGLEKTGTTSIQHFCSDNARALERAGVHYPTRNAGFGLYNHAPIAAAYLEDRAPDFTLSRVRGSRKAVLASVLADIERSPSALVLISAEHFSSRFEPADVERLCRDFEGFEKRIAVTVRNHHARLFSSYATYVWGGGEMPLNDYASQMLRPGNSYFRVADTIGIWQDVFGRDRIDLLDYDAHRDVVPAFLRRYGAASVVGAVPRSYRDKPALKPSAVEAVRLINRLVTAKQRPTVEQTYPVWLQRRYFQRLSARKVAARAPSSDERWRIDPRQLRAVDEIAATDRRWLEASFGLVTGSPAARDVAACEGPPGAGGTADLLAQVLVDESLRGRWAVSEALVSALTGVQALAAWFRRRTGSATPGPTDR